MPASDKVVAIIQARMRSTRLPGKVLKDLSGETVLSRVVNRLRAARLIDELLIATTDQRADDEIVSECKRCRVAVFRGDENDVLDRYFRAAQFSRAEIVVRITSDCPLIDPEVTDKTIRAFLEARSNPASGPEPPDYGSNVLVRTYPRGLDTEVVTVQALERAWRLATEPYQRAHVTPYIVERSQEFKLLSTTGDADYSQHRWTLDTPEDLEFIRAVYARAEDCEKLGFEDVLRLLEREPQLVSINASVAQKALHER